MVRSSNKGISGLIGPLGELINVTNSNEITYLDVKIPTKLNTTFYREHVTNVFLIVYFYNWLCYSIKTIKL